MAQLSFAFDSYFTTQKGFFRMSIALRPSLKNWLRRLSATVSALVIIAAIGCGSDGPQLAEVVGTVTVDGKPVPNAVVTFNPVQPGGSNSLGKTDAQGKYRLSFTQDKTGAMIGEHVVEIATKKMSASDMPDDGSAKEMVYVEIPKKYRERGTLKAEVKNQRNTIDFELSTK